MNHISYTIVSNFNPDQPFNCINPLRIITHWFSAPEFTSTKRIHNNLVVSAAHESINMSSKWSSSGEGNRSNDFLSKLWNQGY